MDYSQCFPFSRQLNCLVCTQVMEEGMDVPRCTLVVRFDPILNYRSYIQAKGRGRHKKAVYAMLVDEAVLPKFRASYQSFQSIEKLLNNVIISIPEMHGIIVKTLHSTESLWG